MLVSGVAVGIAAAIAFGGHWRRLANLNLNWWPLLVVASALRVFTYFEPKADLKIYLAGLAGIGLVAAGNWRIPGAALIAIGTFSNVLVIALNGGMPFDPHLVEIAGAPLPSDGLHVEIGPQTLLP